MAEEVKFSQVGDPLSFSPEHPAFISNEVRSQIKKFCDMPAGSGDIIRIATYGDCIVVACVNGVYRVDPDGTVSEIR